MELKKVSTQDDDSQDSLEDNYPEPLNADTATVASSQYLDDNDDAESQKFLSNGLMKKKKYEEHHEEYHPGHASFGMSVFNLSNAIMGSGILGLSYAMANTGIVCVPAFIALFVFLARCKSLTPHWCLSLGSLIYEKLGERAFGWPGKIAAFGSIILQNIGAMSSYLFIVKYELPEVIRAFLGLEVSSGEWYLNGNYLVVFVSVGIILPLSMLKNLGYLGYTSGFSLACMVFFVGVVSAQSKLLAFSTKQMAQNEDDDYLIVVVLLQTAYTIPILAFAFVCHPEVLPIYSELKDRSRKKMQNVSNLSILAMLVMYMLSALFGYLTFYDNVEAELLHTFTKVYKFDTLLLMVRLAVLTAVTLTVPIVLFPIRSSITTLLFSRREFSWIRHLLIAAGILVFTNLLVIFVPTIRDIFGFIGGSAATMLIFILPSAFYLRLVKSKSMNSAQKIGAAIFLVVGIIFMIGSLSLIVLDWVHNPPGSNGSH
uniref:Solute carrier family 38 member 4 n=1 Tax=Neogobius melanostomus TaxID=47308 RepID=A0A8C6UEM0_9GOBI